MTHMHLIIAIIFFTPVFKFNKFVRDLYVRGFICILEFDKNKGNRDYRI